MTNRFTLSFMCLLLSFSSVPQEKWISTHELRIKSNLTFYGNANRFLVISNEDHFLIYDCGKQNVSRVFPDAINRKKYSDTLVLDTFEQADRIMNNIPLVINKSEENDTSPQSDKFSRSPYYPLIEDSILKINSDDKSVLFFQKIQDTKVQIDKSTITEYFKKNKFETNLSKIDMNEKIEKQVFKFSFSNDESKEWSKQYLQVKLLLIDDTYCLLFKTGNDKIYPISELREDGFELNCYDGEKNSLFFKNLNFKKHLDHEKEIVKHKDSLMIMENKFDHEVKIGSQIWMTKNLDIDTFRNGDTIQHIKSNEEWKKAAENKQPAWCYYENDTVNGEKYGKLYNWYAINDPRGLAPMGWHIPSDDEWKKLTEYLGGVNEAGLKMKSSIGWKTSWRGSGNGTNQSCFSALPGGIRDFNGVFYFVGESGYWWSSLKGSYAFFRWLNRESGQVFRTYSDDKMEGMSVRCIKD